MTTMFAGMKHLIVGLILASVAFALPQLGSPVAKDPTATAPLVAQPQSIGQLPKDGLKVVPFPENFNGLASLLGFDLAKATPDPSG
jgi:hypothetical protein